MARPSTEIIEKYNIIEQFRRYVTSLLVHHYMECLFLCEVNVWDVFLAVLRCGLKTVINLQRPGEHASCGNPLEQESGFTYRPEMFMEAGSESLQHPRSTH